MEEEASDKAPVEVAYAIVAVLKGQAADNWVDTDILQVAVHLLLHASVLNTS